MTRDLSDEEFLAKMKTGKAYADLVAIERAAELELRVIHVGRALDNVLHEHRAEIPAAVMSELRKAREMLRDPKR